MGQRNGLSVLDRAAVAWMYGGVYPGPQNTWVGRFRGAVISHRRRIIVGSFHRAWTRHQPADNVRPDSVRASSPSISSITIPPRHFARSCSC